LYLRRFHVSMLRNCIPLNCTS